MDLHSGLPFWLVKNALYDYFNPLKTNHKTDVAIIGSGITGALVAHELCSAGISCTVFDKRTLSTGSSAASTSLLQYEIDVPLYKMILQLGEDIAVQAYHSSLQAISDVEQVFQSIGVNPDFKKVSNIFYASNRQGLNILKNEYTARKKFGLPVTFWDEKLLLEKSGIKAPGALWNNVSAQMDCYQGATALLQYHLKSSQLEIFSHTEITHFQEKSKGYELKTKEGHTINCQYVIVAAGFEAGFFLPQPVMKLTSTFALISQPIDPKCFWNGRSLIWETREPYLYIRTTDDNRVIVGGEDEEFKDPIMRDNLLRKKVRILERKIQKLFPHIPFVTDMAWCGTFSSTDDGLPYIGTWKDKKRMIFTLGYGGNGILFSMIAAQMVRNKLKGIQDARENVFCFNRRK